LAVAPECEKNSLGTRLNCVTFIAQISKSLKPKGSQTIGSDQRYFSAINGCLTFHLCLVAY
jgi:hypothetical protein